MLGMSPSPDKRRRSNAKTNARGSFIAPSGSFIGGSFVEGAP